MAGTIVVDRLESDASYASSINVASPLVVSNTISIGSNLAINSSGINASTLAYGTLPSGRLPTIPTSNMPTGSVLQVIQGTITSTQVVVAAANPLVSTGISATITPQSASSKILVIPVITNLYNGGSGGAGFAIYRGATNVYIHGYAQGPGYLGSFYNDGNSVVGVTFSYLDSPSTASSVTYTIYWGAYGNSHYINYQGSSAVNGTGSYITLMEIAG